MNFALTLEHLLCRNIVSGNLWATLPIIFTKSIIFGQDISRFKLVLELIPQVRSGFEVGGYGSCSIAVCSWIVAQFFSSTQAFFTQVPFWKKWNPCKVWSNLNFKIHPSWNFIYVTFVWNMTGLVNLFILPRFTISLWSDSFSLGEKPHHWIHFR